MRQAPAPAHPAQAYACSAEQIPTGARKRSARVSSAVARCVGPALFADAIIIGIGVLRIPPLEVLLAALPASLALMLLEGAR
jgi:hypothetical protein